jgi:hypothetical protein
MSSGWFVISAPGKPNNIRPVSELVGKTTSDLLKLISDTFHNGHLAIFNEFYRFRLPHDCQILKTYPNLIISVRPEHFPPPPWHLAFIPSSDPTDAVFLIDIKTKPAMDFPPLPLSVTFQEIRSWKANQVLEKCRSTFGYTCTEPKLLKGTAISGKFVQISDSEPASNFLCLPYSKRLLFQCVIADKECKQIDHRIFHCGQMVSTEEAFVRDINELCNFWRNEITQSHILLPDQLQVLFQNVDPIYAAHNFFLTQLKSQSVSFRSMYGAKFLNFVQFFKIGASFVSMFKQNDAMIKDLCRSRAFRQKWEQIESKLPNGSGRDFMSYYVTPVQRYPRYPLLLRDLYKATPAFHPDKELLSMAIAAIDSVNKEIDQSSAKANRLEDINVLQSFVGTGITILDPRRTLIEQAAIQFSKPRFRTGSGFIYLFNDRVLIVQDRKSVV